MERRLGTKPVVCGWKGGLWSSDAYHHGYGKAKGKGDKGKCKGLYALDGSPSAEALWWDEEVAFGLFDEDSEDKQDGEGHQEYRRPAPRFITLEVSREEPLRRALAG